MQHEVTLNLMHKALDREDLQLKIFGLVLPTLKDKELRDMMIEFEEEAREHIKMLQNQMEAFNLEKMVIK